MSNKLFLIVVSAIIVGLIGSILIQKHYDCVERVQRGDETCGLLMFGNSMFRKTYLKYLQDRRDSALSN